MSCSLLIGHVQIIQLIDFIEQWAFENGLPFLIRTVVHIIFTVFFYNIE